MIASQGLGGAYWQSLRAILLNYAGQARLVRFTFMSLQDARLHVGLRRIRYRGRKSHANGDSSRGHSDSDLHQFLDPGRRRSLPWRRETSGSGRRRHFQSHHRSLLDAVVDGSDGPPGIGRFGLPNRKSETQLALRRSTARAAIPLSPPDSGLCRSFRIFIWSKVSIAILRRTI